MYDDESPATSRQPAGDSVHLDIKLPAPTWAKSAATPGGIPPMFAGTQVQSSDRHLDALDR